MLRCPRCCNAGEDQEAVQSPCIDKQSIGCPSPVEVIPGKDVVMACRAELCGKQIAFPTTRILERSIPTEVSCMRSPCEIVVINPSATKKPGRGKAEG